MNIHSLSSPKPLLQSVTFINSGGRKTSCDSPLTLPRGGESQRKTSGPIPFPSSHVRATRKGSADEKILGFLKAPSISHTVLDPIEKVKSQPFEAIKLPLESVDRTSEMSTQSEIPNEKKEMQTPKLASPRSIKTPPLSHSEKQLDKISLEFVQEPSKLSSPEAIKAHQEFLYYLFASIGLIKKISSSLYDFPQENCLSLLRPSHLKSISF